MDNFDIKLETITGVGTTLAAVIFSEIGGDIKKFSSMPKLVAYTGLYPITAVGHVCHKMLAIIFAVLRDCGQSMIEYYLGEVNDI